MTEMERTMKNILLAATALVMLSSAQQVSAMEACDTITKTNLEHYIDGKSGWKFVALQKGYDKSTFLAALQGENLTITNLLPGGNGDECLYSVSYEAKVGGYGPKLPWGPYKFTLGKTKMPEVPAATFMEYAVSCTGKACRIKEAAGAAQEEFKTKVTALKETLDGLKPQLGGIKAFDALHEATTAAVSLVEPAEKQKFIEGSPATAEYKKEETDLAKAATAVLEAAKSNPKLEEVAKEINKDLGEK